MGILVSSSIQSFVQLIGVLLIFVFVLVITYFTTKWMGNIQRGRLTSNNLRVLETIAIGNGKLICLIETGNVYLVVSVGKDNVHTLAQLTMDDLKDTSFLKDKESGTTSDSFQEILAKVKDKIPKM